MIFKRSLTIFSIILTILIFPFPGLTMSSGEGSELFKMHCSGCHVNGGNIIRRNKTLKIKALIQNGINSPEAIAKIAREGVGNMNGYGEILGEGNEKLVAMWVWEQAQNAWIQG